MINEEEFPVNDLKNLLLTDSDDEVIELNQIDVNGDKELQIARYYEDGSDAKIQIKNPIHAVQVALEMLKATTPVNHATEQTAWEAWQYHIAAMESLIGDPLYF